MKKLIIAATAAAFALPVAAQAQETVTAETTDPVPATDVTNAEVASFVDIVLQARAMQGQEGMTEEQLRAGLLEIITASDLTMARFTGISAALGEDEELQGRVQARVMERLAQG